jgi:hypothetical protein
MIALKHEPYNFTIKKEQERQWIFDIIRKKYVLLTPEEWVRQHLLWYMVAVMNYPKGLIAVEKQIHVNNLIKRYDIVVYNHHLQPWMLVECKAPHIVLDDTTLRQLLSYQKTVQCPYGVMTNGSQTYCCEMNIAHFNWLDSLPKFI